MSLTSLVQQRTPYDCSVCCMAMLTDRSYEEALTSIGDAFHPTEGMRREQKALERLGFSHTFSGGEAIGDVVCRHRGPLAPEFFRQFAWGRRALMTVPSLNYAGKWHMIFWDGVRVWDPSPGKAYQAWVELMPDELVLFDEIRRKSP